MSWTLCTSGAAVFKAGKNADSVATLSGGIMGKWSDEVEGRITAEIHTDVVTDHATYPTLIQQALSDACSSLIANKIIAYDMSGYTSRQEAGLMLDFNDDTANDNLKILKQKKNLRFST